MLLKDPPTDSHMALYERAIYLRGLFIQRYAAIEFSLSQLLVMACQHPSYNALGQLPFKMTSKLKRLDELCAVDGPISPFAAELRLMIDQFTQIEGNRHFLAHGIMATKPSGEGGRILAFRLYTHIGGAAHAGQLDMPLDGLELLADRLSPIAADFCALVARIGRESLFPTWREEASEQD